MNIKKLIKTANKPEIYSQGSASMWVDEYISTQLLETHLSQEVDLASRKESTITATVKWILSRVPGDRLDILDLGCGPGLYSEKLALHGHRVTGMDFSYRSIDYAKASASQKKLNIAYWHQNYLELEEENKYDLILMIFTDFGVLPPDQRKILLNNVYRALKPGGAFLFDVLNENYPVNDAGSKEWELSEKGFWRDCPYLVLSKSFYYEKEKVGLNQHTVIDATGKTEVYRFWIHTFSHDDIHRIITAQGFSAAVCHEKVIPDAGMYRSKDVTFCIATK